MRANISLRSDNESPADSYELAELLREVVSKIEQGQTSGAIMDTNGNRIGTFSVTGLRY